MGVILLVKKCNVFFNIPIKACFSNKKLMVSIQTRTEHIKNNVFLTHKLVLIGFERLLGYKNNYLSDLVQLWSVKRYQRLGIPPHTHEFLAFNILLHIKFDKKKVFITMHFQIQ